MSKPMNTCEDGQWLKGMGLSGSQADYILERMGHELQQQRREIVEMIRGMKFTNPAEAGQFSMHADGYNQALDDIIKKVGGK